MLVEALIEIPMGTKNKYEIDTETGRVILDRVLYSSVMYPAEYGFIPNTLAGDGDALDILVLATASTFPGCIVKARVLGYLDIIDRGEKDEKVIAVVNNDPRLEHYQELDDLPDHTKSEIKEFFKTYKALQNITVETKDFHNLEETINLINECRENYKQEI